MLPKVLGGVLVTGIALAVLLAVACHTSAPPLPDGVAKQTLRVRLADREVRVDLYTPKAAERAPVIIVAHGFSRGRRHMAGWGGLLAANGFIAAIPDQPTWTDAARNGRALAELLEKIRSGEIALPIAPDNRAAMVGFSMGGLNTLIAASGVLVDAWVGLDPVDLYGAGDRAAKNINCPAAVLVAEPGPWNRHGNARRIVGALPAPPFKLRVRGATHLDVEWPSDWLGRLACGPTDPARREVFARYALAFLEATLMGDAAASATIRRAATDPAIAETRGP